MPIRNLEPFETNSLLTPARRTDKRQVARLLEEFCAALLPGDRIPTHTELMRQLHVSERAIHAGLNELQRQGRIIRKNGVGTFIAEPIEAGFDNANRTIVAIARPDHSFFDRFLDLLFQHVELENLKLVCQPVDGVDTSPLLLAATLRPLGFLVFGYRLLPLAKQLQANGNRVVLVGAPPADVTPEIPGIYSDHAHGGYLTTNHLIELGHRRIAYAHAGVPDLQRQRRWQGHQRALQTARRAGIALEVTFLSEAETHTWETAPKEAAAFFVRPNAPTGIVAWNDYEAIRLLATLTRAGVQAPAQVSLVGYDALPESKMVYPSLTTVEHGIQQQIYAAVDLLTRPTPVPPTHAMVIIPTLTPRESTAGPRS